MEAGKLDLENIAAAVGPVFDCGREGVPRTLVLGRK